MRRKTRTKWAPSNKWGEITCYNSYKWPCKCGAGDTPFCTNPGCGNQKLIPETNISPENGPLEKEIPIGNHQF